MPADPPRSLLVGVAELLAGLADDRPAGDPVERECFAAASSLRALEEVLGDMPKAPWRDANDRQTYTPYPGERKAYGEALDDWARRLRAALTAPTTGGQE